MRTNSIVGARNKASGASFETLVSSACIYYANKNIAIIDKTPEDFRLVKMMAGGLFTGCFTGKAQPDFKGVLRGGRAVCFECKHTDSSRIAKARVAPHQINYLLRQQGLGALSFVLVSFGLARFYRVPADVWDNFEVHFGKKSAGEDKLYAYRIPFVGGIVLFLESIKCQ